MTRAIAWFARNHVAANLFMAALLFGGAVTLPGIKQEIFPEINLDVVSIRVEYPGAAPEEVEEGICVRIEEQLQGLQGVKRVRSTASEGVGSVTVELLSGEDVRRRLDEIRNRVDGIDNFPLEARKPEVTQADVRFQVIDVAVSGDVDELTLKRLGERTRDEITALPGITDTELVAARPYEISIEVSEGALRRHGITFDEVVAAVQRSSLDLPGGSLKTEGGEILLRTVGQAYEGVDFERIVLLSRPDGTRLHVGDVASVVDGFEETDLRMRFDGRPAVMIQVFRVGRQSALEISQAVREYAARASAHLPEGVAITVAQDDARFLRGRLDTLLGNARSGFLLVILVLALFLRLRLALWVSLGVPISFMGALFLLPAVGISINLISLMAFIVVLGIVVDDAIIVGENVHTQQAADPSAPPLRGAVDGAVGVATPVIFGVLTTVAAFAPMFFVPGPMGRVATVIPAIVSLCLLFSLLESLFILPAHLGHGSRVDAPARSRVSATWRRFQEGIARRLGGFIERRYRPFLEACLANRYLTVATGLAVLMFTAGLLGGGWIQFVFQPDVEGDVTVGYVTMPQGTSSRATERAVAQVEAAAAAVSADLEARGEGPVFAHVTTTVGQQPYRVKQANSPAAMAAAKSIGGHLGEVQIEVVDAEERNVSVALLTQLWREKAGQIPGAEELSFTSTIMSAGAPVEIELSGPDLTRLRSAAEDVKEALAAYPGVIDLRDSFRGGQQQLELDILPSAEALGLSLHDLGNQVRQAFYGHEVQRVQRGRDDVRVMVRYPIEERRSLGDLENMRIRTADGEAVPFAAVAEASLQRGFSTISRVDRRRVISVTADIDPAVANANEILAQFRREELPQIAAIHSSVQVSFEGEQREQREFLSALGKGWLLALFAIYALLAIPLRSYLQPLIIMSAIPFGLVGAVWGHVLLGHDFSMFSLVGVVALSGVVVNDSLVLVDFVNRRRAEGARLHEALVDAGSARFRAILLTSLTTFAGLTPLLLETSAQAQMLIPMGISLAFGVIFATVITLLLVPSFYLVLEDLLGPRMDEGTAQPERLEQPAAV
ncbi:MAG: efflux RND transporter permease subunit [Myxococcota bacterium]